MDYRKLAEDFFSKSFEKRTSFPEPPKEISKGEIGITLYLTMKKDKILVGELSKELNLSSGRTAIALNSLEKKGYIMRDKSNEDKRKVVVGITEKGKEFALSKREKAINCMTKLLEYLGEDDAKTLIRILNKINCLNPSDNK